MDSYPAVFTDAIGSEATTVFNDGRTLRVRIRGVEFVGADFDGLEPETDGASNASIRLNRGELCSCRLQCRIPVRVRTGEREIVGTLAVDLVLGDPTSNGGLDCADLKIVLEYDGVRVVGSGESGWFEDELLSIQSQLPEGVYLKSCINCLYSDYSPYGRGLFGCMMCFRNLKAEYLTVKSKDDFWAVHDRYDRLVQETYLCDEFERRVPGTGYRG